MMTGSLDLAHSSLENGGPMAMLCILRTIECSERSPGETV